MKLRLLAPLLAAALALTTATANPASALDRTQRNVLLFSLGALAIAGAIAADNQKRQQPAYVTRSYPPNPYYGGTPYYRPAPPPPPRYYGNPTAWLPGSCQFQVNTRWGVQSVLGQSCLAQHSIATGRLPGRCAISVSSPWGYRQVFGIRCLTGEGYRISSR